MSMYNVKEKREFDQRWLITDVWKREFANSTFMPGFREWLRQTTAYARQVHYEHFEHFDLARYLIARDRGYFLAIQEPYDLEKIGAELFEMNANSAAYQLDKLRRDRLAKLTQLSDDV